MMIKMFKLIAVVCDLSEYDNARNEEEHQFISVIHSSCQPSNGFFFNIWLKKVPILYFVKHCTISVYSVTNHTAKGCCSILGCLLLVLKCVIVPLVIYFKLMTNLRLFINYKKHGILLLFVIS